MTARLQLHKFRIRYDELRALPKDHIAAFGMCCHAINEINAIGRLYLLTSQKSVSYPEINCAALMQGLTLLRVWSSKIFDFAEFAGFQGKYNKTKDRKLREISETALKEYEEIRAIGGYELAKRVRNKSANHYHLDPARDNASHIDPHADVSMFMSDNRANSFYLLGEDIAFGGLIAKLATEINSGIDDEIKKWVDFNMRANDWANDFHATLFVELILPHLSDRVSHTRDYWLPSEMVAKADKGLAPLFLHRYPSS